MVGKKVERVAESGGKWSDTLWWHDGVAWGIPKVIVIYGYIKRQKMAISSKHGQKTHVNESTLHKFLIQTHHEWSSSCLSVQSSSSYSWWNRHFFTYDIIISTPTILILFLAGDEEKREEKYIRTEWIEYDKGARFLLTPIVVSLCWLFAADSKNDCRRKRGRGGQKSGSSGENDDGEKRHRLKIGQKRRAKQRITSENGNPEH